MIFILCSLSLEIKAQWVGTNMPAKSILLNNGNLYTTYSGVNVSSDNGISWLSFGLALSNTSVFSLTVDNFFLFAVTQGKLWRRPLSDIVFPQCTLKVISAPFNGRITSGDGIYNFADSVTVSASPNLGYTFIDGSDENMVVSTNINYSFAIDKDGTLIAKFSYIPETPLTSTATSIRQTGFTVNWNTVNSASGYYVDIAIDQNFVNKLVNYDNKNVGAVNLIEVSGLSSNIIYYFRVCAYNVVGVSAYSNTIIINLISDVERIKNGVSTSFELFQNHPNPFNPFTTIKYSLPKYSIVTIELYDMLGRMIESLINEEKSSGDYMLVFNGKNLASGIYFYRMKAESFVQTKKLFC